MTRGNGWTCSLRSATLDARPIALALVLAVGGCVNPQQVGDELVRTLPEEYPAEIVSVGFENQPPLDPATLFIDLTPSMAAEEQLRFLCEEVMPTVRAETTSISVATGPYGWGDDDCR